MAKEDEVRGVLDEAAQEIARAQSNPRTWLSWMVYLLARLEEQAAKSGSTANRESYMEMLAALQDAIRNRTRTGGWN
jgi:predicted ATP-binding protein involved in virulence